MTCHAAPDANPAGIDARRQRPMPDLPGASALVRHVPALPFRFGAAAPGGRRGARRAAAMPRALEKPPDRGRRRRRPPLLRIADRSTIVTTVGHLRAALGQLAGRMASGPRRGNRHVGATAVTTGRIAPANFKRNNSRATWEQAAFASSALDWNYGLGNCVGEFGASEIVAFILTLLGTRKCACARSEDALLPA